MKRTIVLDVVGLSRNLLGRHTPFISEFAKQNQLSSFPPEFPALTCTSQSTYLTGQDPSKHGIVGNGWFERENSEVHFWKQSNHLVQGPKIWDILKKENPRFTCAKLFWWHNMYSNADYSITPRPIYPADGRKVLDIYTHPFSLREEITSDLGKFPFQNFWGPFSNISSSQWISQSAQWIENKYQPTLQLVYLPHLDYCLQKLGPHHSSISKELQKIDKIVGELIRFYSQKGIQIVLLSEYGISPVSHSIHLNREFRKQGWIQIKEELGLEVLDAGASEVFAIADHQIAHIYLKNPTLENKKKVNDFLLKITGIEEVKETSELWEKGIAQKRAGDFIAIAKEGYWFTYYYWESDKKAPDFARTIDIHRKPGYDPVELFFQGNFLQKVIKPSLFLLKKKLGIRGLLKITPLDSSLVKGSHGRDRISPEYQPLVIYPKGQKEIKKPKDIFSLLYSLLSSKE